MVKHLNAIIIFCAILIAPHVIDFLNFNLPAFAALALGFAAGYIYYFKSAQQ